jgi:hypothetical protein
MEKQKLYWGKTILSFFIVLLTMPLGHALMRVMEQTMSFTAMNRCAFAMGAVGLALGIWGVFVKGDTKQTLFGLFGGLLFWTGWIEFLMGYFAARYGTHYDLDITEFHNYKMTWDSKMMTMYVDDFKYQEIAIDGDGGIEAFRKPFFFVLNVAVGGQWPGFDIDDSQFPNEMLVDYIRVYK